MKSFISKFIFSLLTICATSIHGVSIQTTNRVLVNVGEKAITVLDVKKEMDRQIYIKDKHMFTNPEAVYRYYAQNWKYTLKKLTEDETLLLEANKMGYKIPEVEITQKVTELFGENSVVTCKELSITPEEARRISNREIISLHLSWFNIWNKTVNTTTPKIVKAAYEKHITELAKKDKWTYQAITVKGKEEKLVQDASAKIKVLLEENECSNLTALIDSIRNEKEQVALRVSKDITLEKSQLSDSLLSVLGSLEEGMASDIISSKKGSEYTGKIFQLKSIEKKYIPEFVDIQEELKNTLVSQSGSVCSQKYFQSLYKKYDIYGIYGEELNSCRLEPFSLQND